MQFGAIVAARTGSTRLPGKVLLPLMGLPVIVFLLRRLRTSKKLKEIILATTKLPEDDVLAETVKKEGFRVFRGSQEDVLGRYVMAGKTMESDYIVRATGDCPFVDGVTVDYALSKCEDFKEFDLVTTKPAFPHGIDYEIYPKVLLEKIDLSTPTNEEREHILNFVYNRADQFKIRRIEPKPELANSNFVFLLDTQIDYEKMKDLVVLMPNLEITPAEIIRLLVNVM